ncbi:hypothetical protein ACP3WQ_24495, partial [Salmonella enterica]|uniref:hypothetical protein n=1 Tax=Salmonella enterica TaxID=28901 RepID=UPI003CE8DA0C
MDLFVRRDLERKRTAAGVRKALRANGYTEGKTRANITKYTNVTGDTIKVAYTKKAYGYTSDTADLTVNEFW